ncbi:MAG: ADP-heptose--LPS heptosyltransferase [Ignavibacteria bacterium RBG_16_34_14]|nr:MAG: ADP-heptose--LPS heptosyltransferase [Ignavibacteria bacterium RBG_16_34_14]
MAKNKILSKIVLTVFEKLFSVEENKSRDLGNPKRFLIVRQHNQLGDLLSGVSLFRAIKETYHESHLTLIVSPYNYPGLIKNKYIDRLFIFDKKKIYNPFYFRKFIKIIKESYNVVIVPVTVSISFTSNFIARLSNSKIRIGPKYLDGRKNESDFFFDKKIILDWRRHPDSHVSDRILDIVRPFGINTTNYHSEITFDQEDVREAEKFVSNMKNEESDFIIGLHVGAAKIQNRWSALKYASLIRKLNESFPVKLYLTGSSADKELIKFVEENVPFKIFSFINKKIPEVAALVSLSDIFICNDTGIMHVAGTTNTPQISIFGSTNPFNWAPIGTNKYFIRKSELIDDISVDDVFNLCKIVLAKTRKEIKIAN